jgi:hypothetical protein
MYSRVFVHTFKYFFAKNIETFLKKKDRAVKTRVLSTENDEKMPECKKNL